jgi:hypothetical protein
MIFRIRDSSLKEGRRRARGVRNCPVAAIPIIAGWRQSGTERASLQLVVDSTGPKSTGREPEVRN